MKAPIQLLLARVAMPFCAGLLGAGALLLAAPARSVVMDRVTLGPADELILSEEATSISAPGSSAAPNSVTSSALTIAARGSRPSWGSDPTARSYSEGALHLDRVMRALLQSERFETERRKLKDEAETKNAEFEKRFKEFQDKYGSVDSKSPDFAEAQNQYNGLRSEFETWMQGIQRIQGKLAAEQIESAYKDIVLAVEVVAERRKIDSVLRFVPASRPFEAGSVADAMLQIHARTFLRLPAEVDITEDVMKEMALTDPEGSTP